MENWEIQFVGTKPTDDPYWKTEWTGMDSKEQAVATIKDLQKPDSKYFNKPNIRRRIVRTITEYYSEEGLRKR